MTQDLQLIPYAQRSIGAETIETVDGRDLHAFLEIGKDYSSWIKVQLRRAQLIEDKDYTVFTQKGENSPGGRPSKEYFLTFDGCKHVSMISGSSKGREAREYFIDCEKALNEIRGIAQHGPLVQIALQYEKLEREQHRQNQLLIERQQKTIEVLQLASRADGKADMALDDAHRFTVEEFILKNGLIHQFPPSQHRIISDWISRFCFDWDLKVLPKPVVGKQWETEKGFPLQALAAWLRYEQRRPRQLHIAGTDEPK